MAFSSVGSLGTATTKTVGTTLSITFSRGVSAGGLVVVWAVWDTGSTLHPNITDSKGNVYTLIGWVSHGSIDLTALYYCVLQTAVTNADTLTLTGSNLAAKAMSVEEFGYSGGSVKVARTIEGSTLTTLAADPGAISLAGMDSQEYLFLHALGAEAPSTDAYTWDVDYTQITSAGTTGGVADTNVTILGGYRIATLTGDTVDVTSDTADRDYCQILTALCEAEPYPTFPNTPIIDTFNRADEDPLSGGGTWTSAGCTAAGSRFLRNVSNQAGRSASGAGGGAGSWRVATLQTSEQEIYLTVATVPVAGERIGAVFAGSNCANTSTMVASGAWYIPFQSGVFPGFNNVAIGQSGFNGGPGGAGITNQSRIAVTFANGNKLGWQTRGKVTHFYLDLGGGWAWYAAIYRGALVGGGQKDGVDVSSALGRADDYGGGDIPQLFHLLPILGVGS